MLLSAPPGATYVQEGGALPASSALTAILSHATTANAKNATPVELIASLDYDCHWIEIRSSAVASSVSMLVDIMVGAASSEQVLIANLLYQAGYGAAPLYTKGGGYLFPVFIPAGTRISATCQAEVATQETVHLQVICYSSSPVGGGGGGASFVEELGAITATSLGTAVTPSTTAHTKGAWQSFGTLTYGCRWVSICVGTNSNTTYGTQRMLLDIGIGSATNESVVVADLAFVSSASGDLWLAPTTQFPLKLPAGTEMFVRAQSDIGNNGDRIFDAVIHGVI